MTISTPTTATARNDSLPSVVVSPGEWSREDWPDWSRTSVDELGEDSEILSEVAKDTVQSFNHDSLTEWLESVTVRTRNRFQSETSDFLRQAEKGISEEPLLTSRIEENSIHSEQREDEQSGNEDDDYSEEKRLEWLAKLEMYRRTLGVDSFDLNDGKKEHVDNFTESHKMETVLTTEAAGASLTYVESQYTKTTCISSDEFHSLSSEHTQWDDDDVEITHRKAVEEIEMPSLNYFLSENLTERANKNGFGGSQSDEDDQWHKCLSDVDGSSSDTTSTAMMMSKLNLKQPDEDIIIPISRLDDNGISQTMGSPKLTALRYNKSFSKDGETDEHYSSPHVSRILQKESSYSKSDVGKVSSKDCSIQSDIFSTKVPSVTSSQSILADFYKTMPRPRDVVSWHEQDQLANSQQDCEQDSENRQLKIDKKAKSPVFNPFPVARTSQIWGSSGIGVKLGLYDPSTAGSISQKTVKKQNQR